MKFDVNTPRISVSPEIDTVSPFNVRLLSFAQCLTTRCLVALSTILAMPKECKVEYFSRFQMVFSCVFLWFIPSSDRFVCSCVRPKIASRDWQAAWYRCPPSWQCQWARIRALLFNTYFLQTSLSIPLQLKPAPFIRQDSKSKRQTTKPLNSIYWKKKWKGGIRMQPLVHITRSILLWVTSEFT